MRNLLKLNVTADGIMSTFAKTIDKLETLASVCRSEQATCDDRIKEIQATAISNVITQEQKGAAAAAEAIKATNYANNLKTMMEV